MCQKTRVVKVYNAWSKIFTKKYYLHEKYLNDTVDQKINIYVP